MTTLQLPVQFSPRRAGRVHSRTTARAETRCLAGQQFARSRVLYAVEMTGTCIIMLGFLALALLG